MLWKAAGVSVKSLSSFKLKTTNFVECYCEFFKFVLCNILSCEFMLLKWKKYIINRNMQIFLLIVLILLKSPPKGIKAQSNLI